MRTVVFYHKDTGLLNGTHFMASDDELIALNTPPNHIAIEGDHDHLTKRVDVTTGEVVDYQRPADELAAEAKGIARQTALMKIASLEASQHRAIREAALGGLGAAARLQSIDDQISALRADL
jgi:hypothetical protein